MFFYNDGQHVVWTSLMMRETSIGQNFASLQTRKRSVRLWRRQWLVGSTWRSSGSNSSSRYLHEGLPGTPFYLQLFIGLSQLIIDFPDIGPLLSFIKIVSVIIIMLSWKENQGYGRENLLSTSESIPEIGKRPQIGWSGSCNRFIASSLCKKTILMKDTLCCNIALTWRKIHFNVFFLHKIWWSEVDC